MKKKLAILLAGTMIASTILAGCGSKEENATNQVASGEMKGDITFWHSFTQGPRLEVIQETADQFMKDNPGVNIKIETFSWGGFLHQMDNWTGFRKCARYEYGTSGACGRDDGCRCFGACR